MAAPISIFVADAHPLWVQGISLILAEDGFEVVGSATDGVQAARQIVNLQPQVALLCYALPSKSGIDVIRYVKDMKCETHIVILSAYTDPDIIHEALSAGACGYFVKTLSAEGLITVIEEAADGKATLLPKVVEKLAARLRSEGQINTLTPRENDVLRLVAEGMGMEDIAERLNISPDTVRSHKKNIMAKLDTHTVAAAVAEAMRSGILT